MEGSFAVCSIFYTVCWSGFALPMRPVLWFMWPVAVDTAHAAACGMLLRCFIFVSCGCRRMCMVAFLSQCTIATYSFCLYSHSLSLILLLIHAYFLVLLRLLLDSGCFLLGWVGGAHGPTRLVRRSHVHILSMDVCACDSPLSLCMCMP